MLYKLSEDKVKAASQKNWEIPADDLLWAQRKTKLANFRVKWSLLKKYCFCSTLLVCLMTKQVLISGHNWTFFWNIQLQLYSYLLFRWIVYWELTYLTYMPFKLTQSNSGAKFSWLVTLGTVNLLQQNEIISKGAFHCNNLASISGYLWISGRLVEQTP